MRFVAFLFLLATLLYGDKPALVLLKNYHSDMNVSGWVMSEKLDGVRAYWNGEHFLSRNGNIIESPTWFTKDFPGFALDGELWSQQGDFENIASIVSSHDAQERWKGLAFYVFEVPDQEGGLLERLEVCHNYLKARPNKYIHVIEQHFIKDKSHLEVFSKKVTVLGGEGVVLRDPKAAYFTGRSSKAIKYKAYLDDECRVEGIIAGKGKYKGKMGSLACRYKNRLIRIGTGFSDLERSDPPSVGTLISFKYYGLTRMGNPRFPVFLRERYDEKLHQ